MPRLLAAVCIMVPAVLTSSGAARAADPTTAECLAASEASVKAASDHHLRAERAALLVCAATTCPTVIRAECLSHVSETNAQIPTLIIAARDGSGADLSAVRVTMDGEVLTEKLDGGALSIDPGDHTFTFATAGQPPVTRKFLITQAQKDRRELITFGATPVPVAAPAPAPAGRSALGGQRLAALVVGGAGVIGLGVGTAFGAVALSQKGDARTLCPGATCPSPAGVNEWSSATASGTVSTIALIAGGVAVAGAAVLWFTAPRAKEGPTAALGVGPRELLLRGTW